MTVPLHDDPLLAEIPVLDGFKVLEPCVLYSKLGEGGMGAVYRGRHLNLDIDVAVKCLRRSLADQGPAFVHRFQREARLAAAIHHQNLVQVYDVSQKSGVHYLVMEFVSGETARDRVRRKGPLPVSEALRIVLGAAGGLAEAHGRRIIHRDVKPDNVLIARDGQVKVSDLGLAKALEGEVELTQSQAVMGTPQYMAPEQWEDSSKVTPAVDVWALGATLYFLLAGSDPIKTGTMQQVMRRICLEPFPDIRTTRPEVPEAVADWIARCTARELDERCGDCRAALPELRKLAGQDRGELVSQPGETTQMGATMVSPPPPETLTRIRVGIETQGSAQAAAERNAPSRTAPAAPPAPSAPPPAIGSRPWVAFAVAGSLLLAALALFLALRPPERRDPEVTADTRAPSLERHEPAGPLERGERVSLTLFFDEALRSATIDGDRATIEGRTARWSGRAPEEGASWAVAWRALDQAKNEATGSLELPLQPLPEPVGPAPPAPRAAADVSRRDPSHPRDCVAVGSESIQIAGQPWAKRVQHTRTGIHLALVPHGSFVMGSSSKADKAPPPRTVTISRDFYMSEDEVTELEFARGMGERSLPADNHMPKAGLSWVAAKRFCREAGLELPTEAEWEYACRAGSQDTFAFGSTLGASQGVTFESGRKPRPTGERERNGFGLADMHGNVQEYCADEYLPPEKYAELPPIDPFGKRGDGRVLRGGSYVCAPSFCAAATRRLAAEEKEPATDAGLRVVLHVD